MRFLIFVASFTLLVTVQAGAQSEECELAAIEAAARDYIEGWYEGDAERMESAISTRLAKRIAASELDVLSTPLVETTALELVRQTGRRTAEPLPEALAVTILDRFENAASVRVDAGGWVDYMHLARIGGEWKIVNVLWEIRETE